MIFPDMNFLRFSKWEIFLIVAIAILGIGTGLYFIVEAIIWLWQHIQVTWGVK